MIRVAHVVVALATATAVGCGGAPKPTPSPAGAPAPSPTPTAAAAPAPLAIPAPPPLPPIPSTPAPAPADLVARASAPALDRWLPDVAAYADAVEPGSGAEVSLAGLRAKAAALGTSLAGIELSAPVRVLALDPARHPDPWLVVVSVRDEAAVTSLAQHLGLAVQLHRGRAALGPREALEAAGAYALTTFADEPVATRPTATVAVAYLVDHYGPMLYAGAQAAVSSSPDAQRPMLEKMLALYLSLFQQVDTLELGLEVSPTQASVLARVVPRGGGGLATFIARQRASSFAGLEHLPVGSVTMAGRLELDELWDAMGALMTPTYGDATVPMMDLMRRFAALDLGDYAMSADLAGGRFAMAGVMQVGDPAKALALWGEQPALMRKSGLLDVKATTTNYHGARLMTVSAAPRPSMPAELRAGYDMFGGAVTYAATTTGKQVVFVIGLDATARAKGIADRLRAARRAATAALAPVYADARARGESVVMTMDLARLVAAAAPADVRRGVIAPVPSREPTALALGTDHGALTLRLTLPASQVAMVADVEPEATPSTPPAPGDAEAILAAFERVTNRVCACKDMACVDGAINELANLAQSDAKPDEAQMQRAQALAERLTACQAKLLQIQP